MVLALAILACPVIAIEYQTYENGIFKVEYPTNWIVQEPTREDVGAGSEFASRLAPYQESRSLHYVFRSVQGDVHESKATVVLVVQVNLPEGGIIIELQNYRNSFSVLNQTGYIDDPLIKGLNETEYMNDPRLHFLSTFQAKTIPDLKEIYDSKLSPEDEQLKRVLERSASTPSARHSSAMERFQNLTQN